MLRVHSRLILAGGTQCASADAAIRESNAHSQALSAHDTHIAKQEMRSTKAKQFLRRRIQTEDPNRKRLSQLSIHRHASINIISKRRPPTFSVIAHKTKKGHTQIQMERGHRRRCWRTCTKINGQSRVPPKNMTKISKILSITSNSKRRTTKIISKKLTL